MASPGETDDQKNKHAGRDESDEFSEEFMCCVCLDLVYKPVVLACGHISCFWCVFEAMGHSWHESRCPVCRRTYNHFPSICRLLHFVLMKLYPLAYKRRERQVVFCYYTKREICWKMSHKECPPDPKEEEKKLGTFSPQFDGNLCESYSRKKVSMGVPALPSISDSKDMQHLESYSVKEGELSVVEDSSQVALSESSDKDVTTTDPVNLSSEATQPAVQESNEVGGEHDETCKWELITDVLCAQCKQLLYRPVVLNCGHVFCEGCIINPSNKLCRCPECQSMHPNGFPKVCLVIEHFLEEHVSEEYAARRAAVDELHNSLYGGQSTGSIQAQHDDARCSSMPNNYQLFGLGQKVHFGVGCDCCGMYPITGERHKCKDCVEFIGFDLCDGCYKSSSRLPGRFNQQHRPEHDFVTVEPPFFLNVGFLEEYGPLGPEGLANVTPFSGPSDNAQPESEPELPVPDSSNDQAEEAREPSP